MIDFIVAVIFTIIVCVLNLSSFFLDERHEALIYTDEPYVEPAVDPKESNTFTSNSTQDNSVKQESYTHSKEQIKNDEVDIDSLTSDLMRNIYEKGN